jgi:hypothetical protein
MSQKVQINGLSVVQKNGKTFVNGKDISSVTSETPNRFFMSGLIVGFLLGGASCSYLTLLFNGLIH